MGYGVWGYSVQLSSLDAKRGSGDVALLAEASRDLDPEKATALSDLVMGHALDDERGPDYGYALERLCAVLGERLDIDSLERAATLAEEIDEELARRAVPHSAFSAIETFNRGCWFDLPEIADWPGVGYLRHGEVTAGLAALSEGEGGGSDETVGAMISELRAWLAVCAVKGTDLVIFCY